jgi:two-component system, NtrC family, sensor kinase
MIGRPLKDKILLSFLAIISVLSLSTALLGYYIIKKDIIDSAQRTVKDDLSFAREVYRQETKSIESAVRFTAIRDFLRDENLTNNTEILTARLNEIRKAEGLDVLTLVNKEGRVIVRARNPLVFGDEQKSDEVVSKVLSEKTVVSATTIVTAEELSKEGQGLVEQAYIEFKDTPKAKPTKEIEQTSGMMIKAAAPVYDNNSNIIGVLYGGNLLNRNYGIVDRVKSIVYQETKYGGKDIGTVTIFQNDLRISTNVMGIDGNRAIGTRVSAEVYDQVIVQGRPWVNSAFVVNDWYKTAYEPINNINGQIIGMLYIGTLAQPFNDIARNTMLIFLLIVVTVTLFAIVLSFVIASHISRPLTDLIDATAKLSTGKLGHTIEAQTSVNELNKLAVSFNEMSGQLEERDSNLKLSNELLAELNKRYIDLIGFVSHELKGILATVVMNVCSVQESILGPINEKQKRALDGAARSLDYLTATVKKFLNLGKIEKGELEVKKTTVNLKKCVFDLAVNSQLSAAAKKNMTIRNEIEGQLCVEADVELMQIVATNLIINAVKYGREHGTITLSSKIFENVGEIEVYNDSEPIRQEDKEKLFKRFSRLDNDMTKNVKGTGLGLFVTKQIIEKHGGKIWVEPREKGNSFIFQLAIR